MAVGALAVEEGQQVAARDRRRWLDPMHTSAQVVQLAWQCWQCSYLELGALPPPWWKPWWSPKRRLPRELPPWSVALAALAMVLETMPCCGRTR